MFKESKKKDKLMSNCQEGSEYISCVNARKNPDLMVTSGKFLKGNHYFKENVLAGSSSCEEDKDDLETTANEDSA